MKICAIISEYNPFHSGHAYHIRQAKEQSNADFVLCIMSGNFVQRGESAVLDKYERAAHAIKAGADAVIELPTVFATSPAEPFAKGGVKIASAIPSVTHLCFGAETPDKDKILQSAALLNDEPKCVSEKIKAALSTGKSLAKARADAYGDKILSQPNDLLAVEYARAVLSYSSNIELLPIKRIGAGYKESELNSSYPSATAVRKGLKEKTIRLFKDKLPEQVFISLQDYADTDEKLDLLERYALLSKSAEEIRLTPDCTEGLENGLKRAATEQENIVSTLTSARYTSSRIRRILLQNLLSITAEDVKTALSSPLYLRLLAAKKNSPILSLIGESDYPILVSGPDEEKLSPTQRKISEKDAFAQEIYTLLTGKKPNKQIFY